MVMNSELTAKNGAAEGLINPIERPDITQALSENVVLTSVDDLYNWAKLSSLWPLLFGTACCFIEFAALIGSRFDFDRFGLVPRSSPRQADLIITAGTITMKMINSTSSSILPRIFSCEESEVAQLIHEVGSLNSDCTILQLTSAAIRGCCISPNPFSNAWKLIS